MMVPRHCLRQTRSVLRSGATGNANARPLASATGSAICGDELWRTDRSPELHPVIFPGAAAALTSS